MYICSKASVLLSLMCLFQQCYSWIISQNPLFGVNTDKSPKTNHRHLSTSLVAKDFSPEHLEGTTFKEEYEDTLPDWLLNRLEELGYTHPTEVQRKALKAVIKGDDAVIHAQTGSGKTLSFLLPIFASVNPKKAAVQAIIVVPTRELGMQVASVAKRLAAATGKEETTGQRIHVMSLLEGSQNKRQRAWATSEPPQIVIGNPHALAKLIKGKGMRYNTVRYVVIDEVDACLLEDKTRNTLNDLLSKYLSPTYLTPEEAEAIEKGVSSPQEFLSARPKFRQTIFASATVPQHNHFIKQCFQKKWTVTEPSHIYVTPQESIPACLDHFYVVVSKEKKLSVLRRLIIQKQKDSLQSGIVFAQETWPLEEMSMVIQADLEKNGRQQQQNLQQDQEGRHSWKKKNSKKWICGHSEPLREEYSLSQRADILEGFRSGQCAVLVATDLAARGLDVPQINVIFNFDLPKDAETYLHRAGRAGRLGRPGQIISLITQEQEFVIQRLGNQLGIEINSIESSIS